MVCAFERRGERSIIPTGLCAILGRTVEDQNPPLQQQALYIVDSGEMLCSMLCFKS